MSGHQPPAIGSSQRRTERNTRASLHQQGRRRPPARRGSGLGRGRRAASCVDQVRGNHQGWRGRRQRRRRRWRWRRRRWQPWQWQQRRLRRSRRRRRRLQKWRAWHPNPPAPQAPPAAAAVARRLPSPSPPPLSPPSRLAIRRPGQPTAARLFRHCLPRPAWCRGAALVSRSARRRGSSAAEAAPWLAGQRVRRRCLPRAWPP